MSPHGIGRTHKGGVIGSNYPSFATLWLLKQQTPE
jgi:hypothetical protein